MGLNSPYCVDLSKTRGLDVELLGIKAYELSILQELNIPILDGFVITTECQKDFLRFSKVDKKIEDTQVSIHPALTDLTNKILSPIRKKILHHEVPNQVIVELNRFYGKFSGVIRGKPLRISSSAFDSKTISFEHVRGDANFILKIKTIWSEYLNNPTAIVVQKDVKPKTTGKIITNIMPMYDKNLTEKLNNELIKYCKRIQEQFYFPKEIEYAIIDNKLFIINLLPFTGVVNKPLLPIQSILSRKIISKGLSINPGVTTGPVKIFNKVYSDMLVKAGDVIVAKNLENLPLAKLKKAKALILESVLPNSLNKAIFRKSFRFPIVEGVENAIVIFHNGFIVTVNGCNGKIYSGGLI